MPTFRIEVTRYYSGSEVGVLEIEAANEGAALAIAHEADDPDDMRETHWHSNQTDYAVLPNTPVAPLGVDPKEAL